MTDHEALQGIWEHVGLEADGVVERSPGSKYRGAGSREVC